MIDIDRIRSKILLIEENLKKLNVISNYTFNEFKDDFMKYESAKHLLQISIEAMVDIANHIIARERYCIPETYKDSFRILMENNIISNETYNKYSLMAKFRNRIVHIYNDVDLEEAYNIISTDLKDFKVYITEILKYINKQRTYYEKK